VLNVSDVIFLQTAPHGIAPNLNLLLYVLPHTYTSRQLFVSGSGHIFFNLQSIKLDCEQVITQIHSLACFNK